MADSKKPKTPKAPSPKKVKLGGIFRDNFKSGA